MIQKHYNQFFEVYRVSSSIDSNNFEIETSAVASSGFGYLEPLYGNEVYTSDKYQSKTTHRLFCEPMDIKEKDEIKISTNVYNIDVIQNYRNHHLELVLILRK